MLVTLLYSNLKQLFVGSLTLIRVNLALGRYGVEGPDSEASEGPDAGTAKVPDEGAAEDPDTEAAEGCILGARRAAEGARGARCSFRLHTRLSPTSSAI